MAFSTQRTNFRSARKAQAALGAVTVRDIALAAHLPYDVRTRLDQAAPASLPVPSGRSAPLTYGDDGTVVASVKLQELFGHGKAPRGGVLLGVVGREGDDELLTAHPADEIVCSGHRSDPVCHDLKNRVPAGLTVDRVDPLHAVEVEMHRGPG